MASAKDLRAKAAELMKKAAELENKKTLAVGMIVRKLYESGYKDFQLDSFKKDVAKLLE